MKHTTLNNTAVVIPTTSSMGGGGLLNKSSLGGTLTNILLGGSTFLLLFIASFFASSLFLQHQDSEAMGSSVDISATISPALSFTVPSNLDLGTITPSSGITTNTQNITVSTNNPTGYFLGANFLAKDTDCLKHSTETALSTPCPSIDTGKRINQTQTTTLGMNTWGLSVDGGSTYLTLPNGVVSGFGAPIVTAALENYGDLLWALFLIEALDEGFLNFVLSFAIQYNYNIIGADYHSALISLVDQVSQTHGSEFLTQSDINALSNRYTYEEILLMFMVAIKQNTNPNHINASSLGISEDEMAEIAKMPISIEEAIDFLYGALELPIPTISSENHDAQNVQVILDGLRNHLRMSIGSTKDYFLQHRQMLTIKNQPNPIVNDLTPITAGINIDHSILPGYYSTQVEFTAVSNDVPVPMITAFSPSIVSPGERITIIGVNFNHLYKVYLDRTQFTETGGYMSFPCEDLIIINANTATCMIPPIPLDIKDGLAERILGVSGSLTPVSIYGSTGANFAQLSIRLAVAITPSIAPIITGVEGGPQLTIVGSSLADLSANQILIGTNMCRSISGVSSRQLVCEAPSNPPGIHSVYINGIDTGLTVEYRDDNFPTLQSATLDSCPTTPTLYRDTRDSQLYYVAKLPDGNCWMVDNLKYGGDDAGELMPSDYTRSLTIDGSIDEGINLDVAKYIDITEDTPPNNPRSYCYNLDNNSTNTGCGFLYNWYSATNGTGNSSLISGEATGSICPSNWRLPTGGPSGEFNTLQIAMGMPSGRVDGLTILTNMWLLPNGPFRSPFSSRYYHVGTRPGSSMGSFWSSTSQNSSASYSLFATSTLAEPTLALNKYIGQAVRCLLD